MTTETRTQEPAPSVKGLGSVAPDLKSTDAPELGTSTPGRAPFPPAPQAAVDLPNKADPDHPLSSEAEHLHPRFRKLDLVDRFIDEPRKLRVAVIGAGLSGVIAGALLPAKVPGIELTIYDKNEEVV